MKKLKSLILAAATMTFAVACNKELPMEAPETAGETVVFTASIDETKAVLKENKTEWVAGDKVTIHNGTKGFEFTAESAGATTDLKYVGNDFSGKKFMAVYPAGEYTADVAAKTVKANIPLWQQAQKGTFDANAALAVAYTETSTLNFKNAVTLLKFKVNTDNVTHVVFHGNKGEGITGNVNVKLTDAGTQVEVLPTEIIQEGNKIADLGSWVEMYAYHDEDHRYFEKGETYYIAIAPQTFEEGVSVKFRINEGEEVEVRKSNSEISFAPNKIIDLGELSYTGSSETPETPNPDVPEWAVAGTFNEWSTIANPMVLENGFYVLKGVTGLNYTAPDANGDESKTGFKFVHNGNWKGAENVAKVAGTWAYVWGDNGKNIYVEGATATDVYDIYLNPNGGDHGKFVIVPTGQAMPEDAPSGSDTPSDPETPTASDWYVAGTFNGWSTTANPMTLEKGFYVLKNVTGLNGASNNGSESSTGFKFVYKGSWKGSGNDGKGKTSGQWEYVWGDGGMNIYVADASATDAFDIYVNPSEGDHGKFVIVPAGQAMPEDAPSTPETPTTSDWYVAGTFNNWSTTENPMVLENGFYVLKNVTGLNGASNNGSESSTGFKFVYKGSWKGSGNDGKGKTSGQWEYVWGDGGMNIYVADASATDAFDIYVNPSEGDHGMFVIVPAGTSL